jgi:uncharacterized protein HemX
VEEQAAPANKPTTQDSTNPTQPVLRNEPKAKQGGKTGLLAAVLIIVVVLLVGGFIFFRGSNKDDDSSTPAPVTKKDELSAGLEQIDQSLPDIEEDTTSLNKINPANDNDPNNY